MTNSRKAFAVPASKRSRDKRSYPGDLLVFLCGEGHFAKQTMERSDFVCVRNEPRSKHNYQETVDPIVILSPLRGSRMTGYGMTFGGFRGKGHLGVGVVALRQAQGPLSLGLAMEARGRLPPPKQKKKP